MLIDVEGYSEKVIQLIDDQPIGDIIEIGDLFIALPKKPQKKDILFHNLPKKDQRWKRLSFPEEVLRIKSMDEWLEKPDSFKARYTPVIEEEFNRRRDGVWFYNNGEPTYITGHHYMLLQWSKMDIGYGYYYEFQRDIYLHLQACIVDERSLGQNYIKCRRSGYTNVASAVLVDDGTITPEKTIGIQSKTGKDAQENIFMKKVVTFYRGYPFFFKPIQDGTTNPRMELAFRTPSKRITKENKVSNSGDELNTVINWKNTVSNAYDGEKLLWLYLDEAGKWEKPASITEAWRIQKTCLSVGRRIVGKAMVGSTVNPMDKGGAEYKDLCLDSDVMQRNANGRTKSGLYRLFIPAYKAFEGFFDVYGRCVEDDPDEPVLGIDGEMITIGAKTFMMNERKALESEPDKLNEYIRQYPFSLDEAFRDSIDGSHFNVGKIYQQIDYNNNMYPNPVVRGNFIWKEKDIEVIFDPNPQGKFYVSWMPLPENRNKSFIDKNGKRSPLNKHIGVGGVDSYDIDQTLDGRGSKGALHMYNKFSMDSSSEMFVVEYACRPDLANTFYEDVLMCAFFYGYELLIENNKYGIVRYFESRGYDNYIMERPDYLKAASSKVNVKTKGIPSNSDDIIRTHAEAIESYIYHHVGLLDLDEERFGKMYFNRTLEDWIGYKMANRTRYDLTISSGLALLAATRKVKEEKKKDFTEVEFLRRFKTRNMHL
jgi:hypothetical protein